MNDLCPVCFLVPATTMPQQRVDKLMELAREGADDPRVREVATALVRILAMRLGRAPTVAETVQWFADAVHLMVDYQPDPEGAEVFQPVQWTLGGGCGREVSEITQRQKGCGDCEDLAALLVALCMTQNIAARVVWLEQPGAPLNHVTAQVRVDASAPDDWQWMEATLPGARLGEYPYAALARLGQQFRSRVFGMDDTQAFRPAGEARVVGLSTRVVIQGMPGGSSVSLGGTVVAGGWEDRNHARWSFMVPVGMEGTSQVLEVQTADGRRFRRLVELPAIATGGVDTFVEVPFGTMAETVDVSVGSSVVIVGMPHGGTVDIDGQPPTAETWQDAEMTRWAAQVPAELVSGDRQVRVTNAEGRTRSATVRIPATGAIEVPYSAMAVPRAVLVVNGMPHGGSVQVNGEALTEAEWLDADMTRWAVAVPERLTGEARRVSVVTAEGTRYITVSIPAEGAAEVRYSEMRAAPVVMGVLPLPTGSSPQAPEVVIVGMPPFGSVSIEGAPAASGRWLDASTTRWAVPVPSGTAGPNRLVAVTTREGDVRSTRTAIAFNGPTIVQYSAMQGAMVPVEAPPEPPEVVIVGMPHFGFVSIEGAPAPSGRWLDADTTRWAVPVPSGTAGPNRTIAVTTREGDVRSTRTAIAPNGPTIVQYSAMQNLAPQAPQGRVVLRGAPAGVQARVVRLVDGAPTQARFLEPDPQGYLAVTLPIGTYHLEVGTHRVPVTVAVNLDSVYDYRPDAAPEFRATVTDARTEPRPLAQTATSRIVVTGVPKTDAVPGATNADASVWRMLVFAWTGPVTSNADPNTPTEGARLPPTPREGVLQPDGTTLALDVPPGRYQIELERIARPSAGAPTTERRSLVREIPAGIVAIPFSEFPTPTNHPNTTTTTTTERRIRVTGVPAGSEVAITGNVASGPRLCNGASDACVADVGVGGGPVWITVTNAAQGLRVVRDVTPEPQGETSVDMSFDVRRAQLMRRDAEGIVSLDATGLRRGYWSNETWDRQARAVGLPDATLRRVVKEFERVTPPYNATGQALFAFFVQGQGMTLAFATPAQVERLKRDVAFLSTGRPNAQGHFPFEIVKR